MQTPFLQIKLIERSWGKSFYQPDEKTKIAPYELGSSDLKRGARYYLIAI